MVDTLTVPYAVYQAAKDARAAKRAARLAVRLTKAADKRVEAAFYATCKGIQIPMLKIPAIFAFGRTKVAEGADDAALAVAIRGFVDGLAA